MSNHLGDWDEAHCLLLMVFLLLGGCSANDDWVHTFTGESDNWIVVMERKGGIK
ncbi:hypothetical protein [Brevibacillus sp. HB1.3]|uniref:hypothetical protein n=1 Tax=Brevibacillus sp. HB1.3 TaxID=2738842 RepID=UPI0020A67641|nr:hypothetical protein [Brevibacillus sp. HB1.3]